MPGTRHLDGHQERAVAVAAGCDPRTVRSYLDGRRVYSTTAARIAAALRKAGHAQLVRGHAVTDGDRG